MNKSQEGINGMAHKRRIGETRQSPPRFSRRRGGSGRFALAQHPVRGGGPGLSACAVHEVGTGWSRWTAPCTELNAIESYSCYFTLATVVSERMFEYPQPVMRDPRLPESAHRDQIRSNVVYLCIPVLPTHAGRVGLFPL